MIIEGSIAIKAAIKGNKRKIDKVYIDKHKRTKDFNYIRFLCHENNIEILPVDREYINSEAKGSSHGGIIASVSLREFEPITELVQNKHLFYIDGVEDPYNLGYVLRTLFAFGFSDVILPKRDMESFEATLLKSSAGAYDLMNIYLSEDLLTDITYLKDMNYHIYALNRSDSSVDIFDCEFEDRACFLVGGEKRGISSRILDVVDTSLYIPYDNDFKMALSAASSVDVLATIIFQGSRK